MLLPLSLSDSLSVPLSNYDRLPPPYETAFSAVMTDDLGVEELSGHALQPIVANDRDLNGCAGSVARAMIDCLPFYWNVPDSTLDDGGEDICDPVSPPTPSLRTQRLDLALVFAQVFLAECPRGVVMSGMLPYFSSLSSSPQANVAIAISLFSLGRLLASLPFGYLVDRTNSSRTGLILATVITIIGQILYMMGPYVPRGILIVLLSRFIIGFGSGTLSISRAFMTKICTPAERTRYISYNTLVQYVGFSFSPILPMMIWFGGERMQTVWGPSFLIIFLNVAVLIGLCKFMSHQDPLLLRQAESKTEPLDFKHWTRNETAFVLFMFLNVTLRGVVGVAETIAAPEYQRLDASSGDVIGKSAQFLFVLGMIGTFTFASLRTLENWMSSFALLQVGMLAILIGSIAMIVASNSMMIFVFGMALIWSIGSPITQVLTISTYSQLMGERPQGAIMGWLTTAGSIGRILLPMACIGSVHFAHAINIATVVISIVSFAMFRTASESVSSPKNRLTAEFDGEPDT